MKQNDIVANPEPFQHENMRTSKWFIYVGIFLMGVLTGLALGIWLMSK